MQWFRVYHDMVTDPKLHEIARRAKVSRGMVIAAWMAILTTASKNEERGIAAGINPVQLGYLIDVKPAAAGRILASIIEQGMMLADGTVTAWSDRQRASDDVNPRVRRSRGQKTKPLENKETDDESNVTNSTRFREEKIESTSVDSPPIVPHPEPVSAPPQSAIADVIDPEPEFELVVPCTALVAMGPTSRSPAKIPKHAAEFAEFWRACPRKVGKGAAEKAWEKAVKLTDPVTIIAKVRLFADKMRETKKEMTYIVHPSRWLNERRWEDEIEAYSEPKAPNYGVDLVGVLTRIEERNRSDRYDDENGSEFGALPALPWPDDYEAPTAARNGRGY